MRIEDHEETSLFLEPLGCVGSRRYVSCSEYVLEGCRGSRVIGV
jgi:hypothetical protein